MRLAEHRKSSQRSALAPENSLNLEKSYTVTMVQLAVANRLENRILKTCKETVGLKKIFAACFYGPCIYGPAGETDGVNILIIVPTYASKIANYAKRVANVALSILVIEKKTFELDVDQGKYGEVAAEIITLPYQAWKNPSYLEEMEIRIKKRLIVELLKNIIVQYPELSTELLIKPQYFMFEVIRRRARLFPPSMDSFLDLLDKSAKSKSVESVMQGYMKALRELENEDAVVFHDSYLRISKAFIERIKRQRTAFSNVASSIQKALSPYLRSISLRTAPFFVQRRKLFRSQRSGRKLPNLLTETEKYLFMPTPLGPVPLSDKTSIQDFVREKVPGGETLEITVEEMGGALNSVFLLRLRRNHETQKVVVKKFEDWLGFKWFPLALWALGTQSFAVLGATRLEREYSINQFLEKQGFAVPRILYVSPKERLIFEDFVEGRRVTETVKRIIGSTPKSENAVRDCELLQRVGEEIAKVHITGVALGDCKPENLLITSDDKVYFLDLEQATRNGNQPWDIAEFLYYSGHYMLPGHSDDAARSIAASFIEGYLQAGGDRQNVKTAASTKYTKVFSIFTLPHLILIMANTCKKMGGAKTDG